MPSSWNNCFSWALYKLGPAVSDERLPAAREFVALGMAAKIIVIVENQNARFVSSLLAIKIRRGKTADTASHDDQIVSFFVFCGVIPLLPIAQRVPRLPGPVMAAAHAGFRRRVIAGLLLWRERRISRIQHLAENRTGRNQRGANRNTNSIQKISPRDAAAHS